MWASTKFTSTLKRKLFWKLTTTQSNAKERRASGGLDDLFQKGASSKRVDVSDVQRVRISSLCSHPVEEHSFLVDEFKELIGRSESFAYLP
jgi:hypothetical protein